MTAAAAGGAEPEASDEVGGGGLRLTAWKADGGAAAEVGEAVEGEVVEGAGEAMSDRSTRSPVATVESAGARAGFCGTAGGARRCCDEGAGALPLPLRNVTDDTPVK